MSKEYSQGQPDVAIGSNAQYQNGKAAHPIPDEPQQKSSDETIKNAPPITDMTSLDDPEVKKALTRSSTTSSVEDWLGLKKSKQDMRMAALAEQAKSSEPRRSFSFHGGLPRISTFRTEKEFRALKKQASTVDGKNNASTEAASSPTREDPPTPKKERPRFLRSKSKKSLASLPTTPSAESTASVNPLSVVEEATPDDRKNSKSPTKIHGGFWQPKRKSADSPGPILAKSRRTGTFDEPSAPPSEAPARPVGVPRFKIPDLDPEHSPNEKYPSSQVSPCDVTSGGGHNPHFLESFEQAIKSSETKGVNLQPPPTPKRHGRPRLTAMSSKNFLPTEARRINTPPVVKPGKGNRLMGHFWDNSTPGVDQQGPAAMNLGKEYVHTPFPMPKDVDIFSKVSGSTDPRPTHIHTRNAEWYRTRANAFLDQDEQDVGLEELKGMFDWDVPDHLPSSPLCPANPRHRGGGSGVCVYHGRGKKVDKNVLKL